MDEIGDYLAAGAAAVALGSELVGRDAPTSDADLEQIEARAARAVAAVASSSGEESEGGAAARPPRPLHRSVGRRDGDVDPDAAVVGRREAADQPPVREAENARQPEQRIRLERPEDARPDELEGLSRQHVVRPQVPRRGVGEVRRVESWIAPVRGVRASLERRRLDGTRARRLSFAFTSGCSISCWIAPGMLSPSSGSEFWSPAITKSSPGFRPPRTPSSS